MPSFFERNLQAFSTHRPEIKVRIDEWISANPDFESRALGIGRRISHKLDGIENRAMVILLGFPCAEDFRLLFSRQNGIRQMLCVVEHDIQALIVLMRELDLSALVSDPSFEVKIPRIKNEVGGYFVSLMEKWNSIAANLGVVSTVATEADREFFGFVSSQIASSRNTANFRLGNSVEDALTGFKNTVENLEICIQACGFETLRNRFKGLTAVSVASGPALNAALAFLEKHKGELAIFACDSALKPLLKQGIMPHFVTAIEREHIVTKYFENVELDPTTTLIGPHVLLNSTISAFNGQRAIYLHNSGIGIPVGLEFLGQPFSTGFSAGNLNISAAIALGFQKIVLVGHNLGYEIGTGTSHAQGVLQDFRSQPKSEEELQRVDATVHTLSQDGLSTVRTDPGYVVYLRQIENEIFENPDRVFINTAMKGLKIEGAKTQVLEEAITASDFHGPQVRKILHTVKSENDAKNTSGQREAALKRAERTRRVLKAMLQESKIFAQKIQTARQKLPKMKSNPHLAQELGSLAEAAQVFRNKMGADPDFLKTGISILQTETAAIDREIALIPVKYSSVEDRGRAYFDGMYKVFDVFCRGIPRILETMEPS